MVPSASKFKDNYFTELCSSSEEGSYLRRIDSCINQLKAQRPSRTGTKELTISGTGYELARVGAHDIEMAQEVRSDDVLGGVHGFELLLV